MGKIKCPYCLGEGCYTIYRNEIKQIEKCRFCSETGEIEDNEQTKRD